MEREHASKYNLTIAEDGLSVYLSGEITLGVNRKFESLLANNPGLKTVILTSEGGNIYEGRGLAKKIRGAGMNTHVESECSSACTLVFIGGVERTMSPEAKLGFHQYRVDADYVVAFADPEAEQSRDQSLFAEAGVSAGFLENMYDKTANDMWFPSAQQLFDAGVVTSQTNR